MPRCITRYLLLSALALTSIAAAQAPLSDPLAYLAARGVSASESTLQSAWIQRAWGRGEQYVYGFQLGGVGETPTNRYFDAQTSEPLDTAALLSLGIIPISPQPGGSTQDAETVTFAEKSAPPRARARADWGNAPEIVLPPLDAAKLLKEDAARSDFERGRLRLGVAQDMPEPISREAFEGAATKSAGGTALLAVRIPGALGLRLHFVLNSTNAAATLRVADPLREDTSFAPAPGDTAWWSPTCWSDTVIVECDAAFSGDFTLDRIVQVYRTPGKAKAAGACELDVSCYPAWQETSMGVGGLGTIDLDEFIFCTASLLVDADPSSAVPFVLTANHCVSSSSQASPLEIYWQYQTSACGGAVPDLGSVPRTTGGAVFLAGNANYFGTDLALLRLKKNPPSGLTWLGWESVAPALGADVVCIHHPDGDFKRISFGDTEDRGSDRLRPASRYHEVSWRAGVTEPGSSGSPLFLAGSKRIIGQLYGGTSACRSPQEPDYYGRFDVSFNLIRGYLGELPNPYDVNGDSAVNSADLQTVVSAALKSPGRALGDLDGNGRVNATDIQIMVIAVLSFSR
jgi:hypothetical protein